MKLRIQGNSIRLRVSRSELEVFRETGALREIVYFGPSAGSELTYLLLRDDKRLLLDVEASSGQVAILLPTAAAEVWSCTEEVGISGTVDLGVRGSLSVLVEKDFACLDRSGEQNADTFPNPLSAHSC